MKLFYISIIVDLFKIDCCLLLNKKEKKKNLVPTYPCISFSLFKCNNDGNDLIDRNDRYSLTEVSTYPPGYFLLKLQLTLESPATRHIHNEWGFDSC